MKHSHSVVLVLFLLSYGCRTSQDEQIHNGADGRADTTIAKLQGTAEQERVQNASIEHHPEFSLGVVEFNDEGLLFSSQQRDSVFKMIRDESKDGAIIVVFVPGWKHNATVCDANLSCFREVLSALGRGEGIGGRRVIGVYLGWRGLTYCNPLGRQFSFWNRKRVGERLGGNQARHVIEDLVSLYNMIKNNKGGGNTRFVAVGHSLGGGVLFSAVGPMYRQGLQDAIKQARATNSDTLEPIKGYHDILGHDVYFPDLVVLANPAFEAELYRRTPADLLTMRSEKKKFSQQQLPLLLSVSSEGDTATRGFFPVGQTLKVLFSPAMWIRGFPYLVRNITTAANYTPYVTDRARIWKPLPATPPSNQPRPDNCFNGSPAEVTGGDCGCDELTPLHLVLERTHSTNFSADQRFYGNVRLDHLPSVDKYNPFLVVTATREVIRDHDDIFSPNFISLLIKLVQRVDVEKGAN
jgi:hypothetical protein